MLSLTAVLSSCSEDDNTVEEYPNWQARNTEYFNHLSDSVKELIALNPARTDWKRLKCWSKPEETEGDNSDYIIVNVIDEADPSETATPIYTDTVAIHYKGRLLPSTSYPLGKVFDASYNDPFDEDISVPYSTLTTGGYIDGVATALQHMRRGDHWTVYIPHQLGYGASGYSSIPGYSTLIFEIRMADFWPPETSDGN